MDDWGANSSAVQDQLKSVQQVQAVNLGGDSSAVQGQLVNVQQIVPAATAFAAILQDGSVVTWGEPGDGGDGLVVRNQLRALSKLRPHGMLSLQSWKMAQFLLGAARRAAVMALPFSIS